MKIETNLDHWGGIRLEIKGESSHENALLQMLARKRICDDYSATDQGSTDGPTQTILALTFREFDKAISGNSTTANVTTGPISTN